MPNYILFKVTSVAASLFIYPHVQSRFCFNLAELAINCNYYLYYIPLTYLSAAP